jgi:hypothetical protein
LDDDGTKVSVCTRREPLILMLAYRAFKSSVEEKNAKVRPEQTLAVSHLPRHLDLQFLILLRWERVENFVAVLAAKLAEPLSTTQAWLIQ